jgi:flagellar hook-length control protein FliK
MEAMIVSPAPGPKAFKPTNNNEAQSGSESTFAPALDQAIKDQNSSSSHSSQKSQSSQSVKDNKDKEIESTDTDSMEESGIAAQTTPSDNPKIEQSEKSSGKDSLQAATVKEAALLPDSRTIKVNHPSKDKVDVATSQSNNELFKTTEVKNEVAAAADIPQKTSKESVVSTRFTQTLSSTSDISKDQTSTELSGKTGNTLFLENNDTISWNQAKSNTANILSKNTTVLQFASEDSQSSNSQAIQVERFNKPSELVAAQSINETTDEIPSLSAEKIAARLAAGPVQTNQATTGRETTSLREKNSSLRQDTNEQFIDAKLENIDVNKQSKTDQQSLNADSETGMKNSFASSPKSIDRPQDVSFSQSLHNISSEKPTGLPVDTLRPGNSFFTPQIQENNILHQVLHKFRISQRMQDSRIVMKLHPAELGDLKIDVQMKDGTVHTNILAQTQQVQDILERNMPRLKAIMEEQGLVVSEITIKLDTDVSDNNTFEEQLAKDESFFAKRKNIDSSVNFELDHGEAEEVELNNQQASTGVNVMI